MNYLLGILGAGVVGGIAYDIVVNKGKYIVPKVEEDGISLGVLYGAVIGFATAILVIDGALTAGDASKIGFRESLTAFLAALGLKGGTEFAATTKLMPIKKKASVSFTLNLKDSRKNRIKGIYIQGDTLDAKGEILIKEETSERQLLHLNFKKEGALFVKDIVTYKDKPTEFSDELELLESGDWEAWVLWDGSDEYYPAESTHIKFKVADQRT